LQRSIDERLRAGMTPEAAARAARVEIGSPAAAREEAMSGVWEARVESLAADVRFALRALGRNFGFAAAAILTIALGIGASTTMFGILNAVLLRPLPWHDAGALAFIWTDDVRRGLHREATAYRTITEWRSSARSFQAVAYYSTQRVAPMSNAPGERRGRSRRALVSANLFTVLGAAPAQGRMLTAGDEAARAPV